MKDMVIGGAGFAASYGADAVVTAANAQPDGIVAIIVQIIIAISTLISMFKKKKKSKKD